MKKILLATSITLNSTPVLASEQPIYDQGSALEYCGYIENLAERIMRSRQTGIPMKDLIETLGKKANNSTKALIVDAYDLPAHRSEKRRNRAVSSFKDSAYNNCYKEKVLVK